MRSEDSEPSIPNTDEIQAIKKFKNLKTAGICSRMVKNMGVEIHTNFLEICNKPGKEEKIPKSRKIVLLSIIKKPVQKNELLPNGMLYGVDIWYAQEVSHILTVQNKPKCYL